MGINILSTHAFRADCVDNAVPETAAFNPYEDCGCQSNIYFVSVTFRRLQLPISLTHFSAIMSYLAPGRRLNQQPFIILFLFCCLARSTTSTSRSLHARESVPDWFGVSVLSPHMRA